MHILQPVLGLVAGLGLGLFLVNLQLSVGNHAMLSFSLELPSWRTTQTKSTLQSSTQQCADFRHSGIGLQRRQDESLVCTCLHAITNGSYVDNVWTWHQPAQRQCNFRHMAPEAARQVVKGECVLFVGDSLLRRLAYTMAAALNATQHGMTPDQAAHDVTCHDFADLAVNITETVSCWAFQWAPKFEDVIQVLKNQSIKKYPTIVIGIGTWMFNRSSHDPTLDRDIKNLNEAICQLDQKRVIVRASPASPSPKSADFFHTFHSRLRNLIFADKPLARCNGNTLAFFDLYTLARDRSFEPLRPPSTDDNQHHFGSMMRTNMAQAFFNFYSWLKVVPFDFSGCNVSPDTQRLQQEEEQQQK